MKGWTVTAWFDAPDEWNAARVRDEIATMIDRDELVTLNAVHTPKPEFEHRLRLRPDRP